MRAAVVGAVFLLAAGSSAASLRPKPTIRFTSLIPVTVRGTHFIPHERVRVMLSAGTDERTRVARTGVRGRFVVDFGTLATEDRCSGSISLLAVGARGDRASFRLPTLNCPTLPPP